MKSNFSGEISMDIYEEKHTNIINLVHGQLVYGVQNKNGGRSLDLASATCYGDQKLLLQVKMTSIWLHIYKGRGHTTQIDYFLVLRRDQSICWDYYVPRGQKPKVK